MPTTLAFLGQLGDAIHFIFVRETRRGGAEVGGAQLLALLREHLLVTVVAVAAAIAIALPIGSWLGHTGQGLVPRRSRVTNVGRAVPSTGVLFALLRASSASGFFNVTLALVLLAIPPILTQHLRRRAARSIPTPSTPRAAWA